jgi:periplasmic divalent cation tolerance protein
MATRLVYMTFPDREAALKVARLLVERRLAACANMIPHLTSVYRWQGEVVEDGEVVLIAKTASAHMAALRAAVIENHPYELPCIVALDLDEADSHAPYIAWVSEATKPA